MKKANVILHLKGLLNSLRNDVLKVLEYHQEVNRKAPRANLRGGFHSIPRQIFCYIDHLGQILYSSGKPTDKGVRFVREHLGPRNVLYRDQGLLIYTMWRHGTVHEYDPKVFVSPLNGRQLRLGWLTSDNKDRNSRKAHLTCVQRFRKRDVYCIVMNMPELVEDLMAAVKSLIRKLGNDGSFKATCQRNFDGISQPVAVTGGSLKSEVTAALTRSRGLVNKKGEGLRVNGRHRNGILR